MHYFDYTYNEWHLRIEEEDGFIISIVRDPHPKSVGNETTLIRRCFDEIVDYFECKRKVFSVPFKYDGTPFMLEVFDLVCAIPYGETRSYRWVAEQMGRPRSYRAVGTACSKSNLFLLVPMHRVISSQGIGGYGGEIDVKRWLLNHEFSVL